MMFNFSKNIEMPLVEVLMDMELTGIRVNCDFLNQMGKELDAKIEVLEQEIYDLAGEVFKIFLLKTVGGYSL